MAVYHIKQQIYALLDLVHQFDANFFNIKKKIIVTLSHCQVQQSRKNDNLEVKLNSVTAIKKADKNFY